MSSGPTSNDVDRWRVVRNSKPTAASDPPLPVPQPPPTPNELDLELQTGIDGDGASETAGEAGAAQEMVIKKEAEAATNEAQVMEGEGRGALVKDESSEIPENVLEPATLNAPVASVFPAALSEMAATSAETDQGAPLVKTEPEPELKQGLNFSVDTLQPTSNNVQRKTEETAAVVLKETGNESENTDPVIKIESRSFRLATPDADSTREPIFIDLTEESEGLTYLNAAGSDWESRVERAAANATENNATAGSLPLHREPLPTLATDPSIAGIPRETAKLEKFNGHLCCVCDRIIPYRDRRLAGHLVSEPHRLLARQREWTCRCGITFTRARTFGQHVFDRMGWRWCQELPQGYDCTGTMQANVPSFARTPQWRDHLRANGAAMTGQKRKRDDKTAEGGRGPLRPQRESPAQAASAAAPAVQARSSVKQTVVIDLTEDDDAPILPSPAPVPTGPGPTAMTRISRTPVEIKGTPLALAKKVKGHFCCMCDVMIPLGKGYISYHLACEEHSASCSAHDWTCSCHVRFRAFTAISEPVANLKFREHVLGRSGRGVLKNKTNASLTGDGRTWDSRPIQPARVDLASTLADKSTAPNQRLNSHSTRLSLARKFPSLNSLEPIAFDKWISIESRLQSNDMHGLLAKFEKLSSTDARKAIEYYDALDTESLFQSGSNPAHGESRVEIEEHRAPEEPSHRILPRIPPSEMAPARNKTHKDKKEERLARRTIERAKKNAENKAEIAEYPGLVELLKHNRKRWREELRRLASMPNELRIFKEKSKIDGIEALEYARSIARLLKDAIESQPDEKTRKEIEAAIASKDGKEQAVFTKLPVEPDYVFVPKGDAYITKTATKLAKEAGNMVYVVHKKTIRCGLQVPREIHETAIQWKDSTKGDREHAAALRLGRKQPDVWQCFHGMFSSMPFEMMKRVTEDLTKNKMRSNGPIADRLRIYAGAQAGKISGSEQAILRARASTSVPKPTRKTVPDKSKLKKLRKKRIADVEVALHNLLNEKADENWAAWEPNAICRSRNMLLTEENSRALVEAGKKKAGRTRRETYVVDNDESEEEESEEEMDWEGGDEEDEEEDYEDEEDDEADEEEEDEAIADDSSTSATRPRKRARPVIDDSDDEADRKEEETLKSAPPPSAKRAKPEDETPSPGSRKRVRRTLDDPDEYEDEPLATRRSTRTRARQGLE